MQNATGSEMPDEKQPIKQPAAEIAEGAGDRLIASKLRQFYDNVAAEGTPEALLDLLERLDEAERRALGGPTS